ncbi:MAG: 23S rRNA (pseudouridine(1915)-N(3))-methyltransferase RlmH [Bacteroidales bacterium]|nr:23S rRNA (pseudouridine(1915)-N(3))-methyltransferase RlmH [Bacteroidales bacterium]
MNIKLILVGKTDVSFVQEGVAEYAKRLSHYVKFEMAVINPPKMSAKSSPEDVKRKEGELIMRFLEKEKTSGGGGVRVVLCDEQGLQLRSVELAQRIQGLMNQSLKTLILIVGGAYGFSQDVYAEADSKLAFSRMTFSHQMIRVLIVEQLYRAFSILNNEPYHNE